MLKQILCRKIYNIMLKMLKKKVKRSIVNKLETVTDVLIMNNGRELIGRKWQITNQGDSNLFIPKVWHPYHDKRLWEDGKYFNQNSPLNSLEKKANVGAYTPTKLKSVSQVLKSETISFLKFSVTL